MVLVVDGNFTNLNVTGNVIITGNLSNSGNLVGDLTGNVTGYLNGINLTAQADIANAGNIYSAEGSAADLVATQQLQATVVAIQEALRAAGILLESA